MKNKKGITLIALIVTIIVMLILVAVTLILTIGDNGIVSKAKEAAFKQAAQQYNEELQAFIAGNYYEDGTTYIDENGIEGSLSEAIQNEEYTVLNTGAGSLAECIPDYDYEKYGTKFYVVKNKLVYLYTGNETERKWVDELEIEIEFEEVIISFKVQGGGEIQGITEMEFTAYVGQELNLTAVAKTLTIDNTNVNFEFSKWLKDEETISTNANQTITITEDAEYTAVFIADETLIYYMQDNEEKIFVTAETTINASTYNTTITDKTAITKILFGKKVTTIGGSAFYGCTNLNITEIPQNVTTIGGSAFRECEGITKISSSIEDAIDIGGSAFEKCINLEEVYLPNIKSWGTYAGGFEFSGCTSLRNVTFGSKGHPVPSDSAGKMFGGTDDGHSNLTIKMYIDTNGGTVISKTGEPWYASNATVEYYDAETGELVNVVIGQKYKGNLEIDWTEFPNSDKITNIKSNAFQNCKNLKITQLPKNCTNIAGSAFSGCEGITKISSSSETAIDLGLCAFDGCKNLKEVYLPNIKTWSTYHGGFEFSGCTSLESVTLGSVGHPVPTDFPAKMFSGVSNFTLKIYIDTTTNSSTSFTGSIGQASNVKVEYYDSVTGEIIN